LPSLSPYGKVPIEVLKKKVLPHTGAPRRDVLLGPGVGEDAAVLSVNGQVIVAANDPVTGSRDLVGYLAVHVNANDVAVRGVRPRWFSSCILLSPSSSTRDLERIVGQVHAAAKSLDVAVVTGHSEITPGLANPIVIGQMMGVAEDGRFVTTGGASDGDAILMTKTAGLEGTAILARDMRGVLKRTFSPRVLRQAALFHRQISVVNDALTAFNTGGVTALHDPTEGGVLGALYELAEASQCGFSVREDRIPVADETRAICEFFAADPLRLMGSGALLICARESSSGEIIQRLKQRRIPCSRIGDIRRGRRRVLIRRDGSEIRVREGEDELWRILSKSR